MDSGAHAPLDNRSGGNTGRLWDAPSVLQAAFFVFREGGGLTEATEALTERQLRTLPARQARAAKFASPEEKSAHYREMARRGNEGRVVLGADEAAAVLQAYDLLTRIAERARIKLANAPNGTAE